MSKATKGIAAFKGFSAMPYFLLLLLASLLEWPHFYFGSFETESLTIGAAESRGEEVAIGFSKFSL